MKFLLDHDVPDDLSYLLVQLGHDVTLLRKALPGDSSDETVLRFAHETGCLLVTCNRDDFLHLAGRKQHHGIVIVVRRRTRGEERAALLRLIERAGEIGLTNKVNFAWRAGRATNFSLDRASRHLHCQQLTETGEQEGLLVRVLA